MSGARADRGRAVPRLPLAGIAALVPLLPIAVALLLSSGGGSGVRQSAGAPSPFKPVQTTGSLLTSTLVPPGDGALVALVEHPTEMRTSPGGRVHAQVATRTDFGSPEAMWVVRLSGPWLGVVSPLAGNGKVGWIPASSASLSRVDWKLEVSLAERRLTVLEGRRVMARYTVAIGAPGAPTPTGRFAVTDRLATGDPGGPYGCCILALSAQAPHVIQGWSGGYRIAIHSTPETWSIGEAVSHGCLRLTLEEGRWLLGHIPIGTPTIISG